MEACYKPSGTERSQATQTRDARNKDYAARRIGEAIEIVGATSQNSVVDMLRINPPSRPKSLTCCSSMNQMIE